MILSHCLLHARLTHLIAGPSFCWMLHAQTSSQLRCMHSCKCRQPTSAFNAALICRVRLSLRYCLWTQLPLLHDARPEVLYQYIHFVGQLLDDLTPFVLPHIYSDASPVAALHVTLDSHFSPYTVKFRARLMPALITCSVHDSAHCIHDADTETDNRPHDVDSCSCHWLVQV